MTFFKQLEGLLRAGRPQNAIQEHLNISSGFLHETESGLFWILKGRQEVAGQWWGWQLSKGGSLLGPRSWPQVLMVAGFPLVAILRMLLTVSH